MRLLHTTSPASARGILTEGFRDAYRELHAGRWYFGSCSSDGWLKKLGTGLLAVEIPDDIAQRFELPAEINGYRRWVIPTEVLAAHGPAQEITPP